MSARCPDCDVPLHAVDLDGLVIQRCDGCSGAWVPQPGLKRRVPEWFVEPLGLPSSQRCPDCACAMERVVSPGGIRLDACPRCHDLHLNGPDLRDILDAHAASSMPSTGFTCVKCGRHRPWREGNAIRGGLACAGCTPQVQLSEGERRAGNHGHLELADVHSLMDLIDFLLQPGQNRRNWRDWR